MEDAEGAGGAVLEGRAAAGSEGRLKVRGRPGARARTRRDPVHLRHVGAERGGGARPDARKARDELPDPSSPELPLLGDKVELREAPFGLGAARVAGRPRAGLDAGEALDVEAHAFGEGLREEVGRTREVYVPPENPRALLFFEPREEVPARRVASRRPGERDGRRRGVGDALLATSNGSARTVANSGRGPRAARRRSGWNGTWPKRTSYGQSLLAGTLLPWPSTWDSQHRTPPVAQSWVRKMDRSVVPPLCERWINATDANTDAFAIIAKWRVSPSPNNGCVFWGSHTMLSLSSQQPFPCLPISPTPPFLYNC